MGRHSIRSRSRALLAVALATLVAGLGACALWPSGGSPAGTFTLAMVPDTQNYIDYSHQKAEGFAIDASELFLEQMGWIAANTKSRGGDIAFVASVGDTWQHPTKWIDPEHAGMGIARVDNPFFGGHFDPTDQVPAIEMPTALAGYRLVEETGVPFGVPPGNHDFDAMYNVSTHPPNLTKPRSELTFAPEDIGLLHIGGLDNFLSVFGADGPLFDGKTWYVDAHDGGTSSAQVFVAGGYHFLHIALEMQAGDDALAWARGVMARMPDFPTVVSTHDYLSPRGTRLAGGFLDLTLVDGENHNTPQQIFEKLVAPSDQIFLVLCGHYHGQAFLEEENAAGHAVYTMLADYQDRGQVGLDAGQAPGGLMGGPVGLGDGWLRLLHFDLASDPPTIAVETYSTHYGKRASEMPDYAARYREHEQAEMSDAEFMAAEEFEIELTDFRARFGAPGR